MQLPVNVMRDLHIRIAEIDLHIRICDLHIRIAEDFRLEIGDAIDAAYEQWQKECDDRRQSGDSTDAGSDAGSEF